MVILRAIGNFFCKIGRWIRDTAWVQPLLIVGGIFAVIFSIPYIVNAVEDANAPGDPAKQFYNGFKKSLKGAEKGESDADKLLTYITSKDKTEEDKKQFGEKFFVSFVEDSCEGCKQVYPGFKTLKENWNAPEFKDKNKGEEFKLYTIFVDEETDDKDLKGDETTFTKHFYFNHVDFFDTAVTATEGRPYFEQQGGFNSNYYNNLQTIGDIDTFITPTTFLIDLTNPEFIDYGISEIVFNFEPKDKNDSPFGYARTLMDCWSHTGVFEKEAE